MPRLSLGAITDDGYRERLTKARAAYLDDRFDESVNLSVAVYLDMMRADPGALKDTRLDATNRHAIWPDYGITLADAGTTSIRAVHDGRAHTMASAVCYFEYILEAVILSEQRDRAAP